MLGSRLELYRQYMNISDAKTMAKHLGMPRGTYSTYVNGLRTPTYAGLLDMAEVMGVSLDWLTGRTDSPMWGSAVVSNQFLWRQIAAAHPTETTTALERCWFILAEVAKTLPQLTAPSWFLPGLCGLEEVAYGEMMTTPTFGLLGIQVLPRLAAFTSIPETWFHLGQFSDIAPAISYQTYEPLLAALVARGISAQEGLAMLDIIDRMVQLIRGKL